MKKIVIIYEKYFWFISVFFFSQYSQNTMFLRPFDNIYASLDLVYPWAKLTGFAPFTRTKTDDGRYRYAGESNFKYVIGIGKNYKCLRLLPYYKNLRCHSDQFVGWSGDCT